jgi:hypothetical protein
MDLCAGALAGMALRLLSLFSSLSPSLPLLQILGGKGISSLPKGSLSGKRHSILL